MSRFGQGYIGRVRFLAICFGFISLVCIGRLYYLQIIKNEAYAAEADRQFVEPASPLFDRGFIFFTDKNGAHITAAANKDGVSLAVQPPKVTDMEALYESLSAITPLDKEYFFSRVTRPGARYVVVAQHLSTSTGARITSAQLPGVVVADDRWRYYPGGSLAAQEIGFVGFNKDTLDGRYGLERFYQQTLSRSGSDLYANFFVELFAGVKDTLQGMQSGDLITTIEPSVQTQLERELREYLAVWQPQFAGGIIMDPRTGAIIAMAQAPDFDLNQYSKQSDISIFSNKLVEGQYEMGSILKPLTIAAGIDAGVITPSSTYNDTGCISVDTKKICNFDLKARGVVSMQEVLAQSLNLGVSHVAGKLGPERMREYFLNRYQFGVRTGIDLPNEVAGQVGNLQNSRQVEFNTASFGQGIAITPIQTVRALAALANDGFLVSPHLVGAIRGESGIENKKEFPEPIAVLAPQTVEQVQEMLTAVVDTKLADGKLKMEHYSIAAKTGTAQIANPQGGGYYTDRYLHSFFGFFPSYDARFIVFLFAFHPQGAQYSSQTWSSVFADLTRFLINYYNIPPDR